MLIFERPFYSIICPIVVIMLESRTLSALKVGDINASDFNLLQYFYFLSSAQVFFYCSKLSKNMEKFRDLHYSVSLLHYTK